jgi:phage virion morphogenesis protein
MADIRTEIENRELMAALTRLRRKTSNLRPLINEIAETMRNSVEENFSKESARERGGVWKALAPATLQARAKKGKTGKKLQVTGQLLASLQTKSSDTEATLGTNKKYARYLNDGTKNMPARPFMVLQKADIEEMKRTVADYLK